MLTPKLKLGHNFESQQQLNLFTAKKAKKAKKIGLV